MDLNREFLRSASAVALAVAKALQPVPELTEPLNLDRGAAIVQTVNRTHDTYNGRVSALLFEESWKTARVNTTQDTYKAVSLNGNTPTCDRPRRRQYYTDKFVFTIPDPGKV